MHERKRAPTTLPLSTTESVKAIIKLERFKEMIKQTSTMDLSKMCNLETISTMDFLKPVIDKMNDVLYDLCEHIFSKQFQLFESVIPVLLIYYTLLNLTKQICKLNP